MASPKSSCSRCSVPHRIGDRSPAGGGACLAFVLNSWPMKPSGVWATSPIRPPGRTTRDELARGPFLVRREHRAEDRADDVEAAVVEGQVLRVALDEIGGDALGLGAPTRPLQEGRDVVDADDLGATTGGGQRGVAAARRHIQDTFRRMQVEGLDEQLGNDQDLGRDHVVVAARPGRLLALFDGGQIGDGTDVGA